MEWQTIFASIEKVKIFCLKYKIKKVQIACSTQSNANGMTICKIVTIYITSNLKYENEKKSHFSTTCGNVKTIRDFGSIT